MENIVHLNRKNRKPKDSHKSTYITQYCTVTQYIAVEPCKWTTFPIFSPLSPFEVVRNRSSAQGGVDNSQCQ